MQTAQDKLTALRAALATQGFDGMIVPMSDEFANEYVPPQSQRLQWLTGFTGSAGMAAILPKTAAFFTDGRYIIQMQREVDGQAFALRHSSEQPLNEWLAQAAPKGSKIGYDAWLHSVAWVEQRQPQFAALGISLEPLQNNPIDTLWKNRPAENIRAAFVHPLQYSGQSSADKIKLMAQKLPTDSCLLTDSHSIAWLLNIRGFDLANTPIVMSYALLHKTGVVDWFVDVNKVPQSVKDSLGASVNILPISALSAGLNAVAQQQASIQLDPQTAPAAVLPLLQGAKIKRADDPCLLHKACKNTTEVAGTRAAHQRDGVALCRFFAWLEEQPNTSLPTEIDVDKKLLEFRAQAQEFHSPSFDTIAGAGPNGAVIHYRATPATNRQLKNGELFLLDSGGQYLDGTTDVTRTIAIGTPSDEMRRHFTLVLKGHIALARAVFPKGTTGSQLDVLARQALWQSGLDFDHGTGHGVGSFLSVHEGPHSISKRASTVALAPGMIVSNEPGYYREGHYGIRTEALLAVTTVAIAGAEREMLGFETLTLVPIDRKLVDVALLTADELEWLNAYHQKVEQSLAPSLSGAEKAWLKSATAPLLRPHI